MGLLPVEVSWKFLGVQAGSPGLRGIAFSSPNECSMYHRRLGASRIALLLM